MNIKTVEGKARKKKSGRRFTEGDQRLLNSALRERWQNRRQLVNHFVAFLRRLSPSPNSLIKFLTENLWSGAGFQTGQGQGILAGSSPARVGGPYVRAKRMIRNGNTCLWVTLPRQFLLLLGLVEPEAQPRRKNAGGGGASQTGGMRSRNKQQRTIKRRKRKRNKTNKKRKRHRNKTNRKRRQIVTSPFYVFN